MPESEEESANKPKPQADPLEIGPYKFSGYHVASLIDSHRNNARSQRKLTQSNESITPSELDMMDMEEGEFEDEEGELEQMAMRQLAAGVDGDDSEDMDYDQQLVEDISDDNDAEPIMAA